MRLPLTIPRFDTDIADDAALEALFDRLPAHPIAHPCWLQRYPYAPGVSFRIFHTGDALCIRYAVNEYSTRALVADDNAGVCADSCVELFIAFDGDDGRYYNFEANPIGTLMYAFRSGRQDPEYAPAEGLRAVRRIATAGTLPFAESRDVARTAWRLTLVIPVSAFFRSRIGTLTGLRARGNLYKCGDALARPHYLAWQPVCTPAPDFHRPEFFTEILFE